MPGNINRAGLLEDYRGTSRYRLQVHGPASLAIGFQVTIDVDQSERKFFAGALKIDPPRIHFNAAKAHRGMRRPYATRSRSGWFREPFSDVPITVRVAHEIHAGTQKRDRPQLQVPAKKTLPAKFHRERFGAKKIFVPESGIVAEGDGLGLESGPPPQREIVATYFDASPDDRFQTRGQFFLQTSMTNQERDSDVCNPKEDHEQKDVWGPTSPAATSRWRIERFSLQRGLGECL